jgi:nucleoside-diphosphate-sugar epimerase
LFPGIPYSYADVLDLDCLRELVVTHRIDWVIHFSALLSAIGEQNVPLAIKVNINGMHNILELAKQYQLKVFIPSTIGKRNSVFFFYFSNYGLIIKTEFILKKY